MLICRAEGRWLAGPKLKSSSAFHIQSRPLNRSAVLSTKTWTYKRVFTDWTIKRVTDWPSPERVDILMGYLLFHFRAGKFQQFLQIADSGFILIFPKIITIQWIDSISMMYNYILKIIRLILVLLTAFYRRISVKIFHFFVKILIGNWINSPLKVNHRFTIHRIIR